MNSSGAVLFKSLRAFQVYGANTDVGKTVITTALCKHLAEQQSETVSYLKPVQTGDIFDVNHVSNFSSKVHSEHLIHYPRAASPHVSARMPGCSVTADNEIVTKTYKKLEQYANSGQKWALVETAGGVLSPGPSKSLQADIYRPLRLPSLLVADPNLGGIASTLASFESLKTRGYDINAVVSFSNNETENHIFFQEHFEHGATFVVDPPPTQSVEPTKDREQMRDYYGYLSTSTEIKQLVQLLRHTHENRISQLENMATEANKIIWYPFTQHQEVSPNTISAIDSAYGNSFQVYDKNHGKDSNAFSNSFDGSASWWTQGLGHGNPQLALTAASAAGRYGHVILANTIHEPALKLAKKVLEVVGNRNLSRVFYSDNGSTGIEVALKMALKTACDRYGWDVSDGDVGVIGLKRSYHGDTIGSMDCTEPSVYNKKVTWYTSRGHWFDYPVVLLKHGVWQVSSEEYPTQEFSTLEQLYDEGRDISQYKSNITSVLSELVKNGRKFGALLLEPVLLGAGGMVAIDPAFQRALVEAVREFNFTTGQKETQPIISQGQWSGLPVVHDEVFSGLYRLGKASASSLIGVEPDVSVHAKLLTGGLVPLSVTLATEEIFQNFISSDKADALLHGHSYTAHPVGCSVALDSLTQLQAIGESWTAKCHSQWSEDFITQLSYLPSVEGVFSLGSVLAIHLKDANPGYTSTVARVVHEQLRAIEGGWNFHTRPLGNVLYLMCGQTTSTEVINDMEARIERLLSQ